LHLLVFKYGQKRVEDRRVLTESDDQLQDEVRQYFLEIEDVAFAASANAENAET
jgi:hypothetical protein